MISLEGLDKAVVLAALYNNAKRSHGLLGLHYLPGAMGIEVAREIIKDNKIFNYLQGKALKVDLTGDELDTREYNEYNGEGLAEKIINSIRE